MQRLVIPLLLLVFCGDTAWSQQLDSSAVDRAARRRAAAAARREAEHLRRRVDFVNAGAIAGEARTLAALKGVGATLFTSGDEQTTGLLVRRRTSSRPEVHARWDDLVFVRAGVGAIELGDSLVDSRYRAPGERIGGTITNRYRIVVHAGDFVRIPAAVPHTFIVSSNEPMEYLVIKQRRQDLPIRWASEK